jgi:phospholipid transport system substrate-binding protein
MSRLTRRHLLLGAVALTAMAALRIPAALAAGPDDAGPFVEALGRDLTAVVNSGKPLKQRQAELEAIVNRSVDLDDVARFCLGRFWRTATPQQQSDYTAQFHRVLVNNVTSKVGEYEGVTFKVERSAPRDQDVVVTSTVIRPNNAPNRVDWLVSVASGSPKIIDVIAEGTSLRLTQRSDYSAYLARNNNTVQALIDAMKQQVSSPQG